MTIGISFLDFAKNELTFISDTYRYLLKDGVVKDVLTHRLEVTHKNFEDCIQSIYNDAPKIFKFGKNTGILAAGDTRFSTILTTLNKRGDIIKQILDELKQRKIEGFWSCRIGKYNRKKEKIELTTVTYENGKVEVIEHDRDTVGFSSFSPEMKDIFFKKYATSFYLSEMEEKITTVKEFFEEISTLYNNKAGGQPIIARLDKNGFRWIVKPKRSCVQNFTTYAYNWMPDRIETVATSSYAWSNVTWTDILQLDFACDAKTLCFIFGFCFSEIENDSGGQAIRYAMHRLILDGNEIIPTLARMGTSTPNGATFDATYHVHTLYIAEKGSHTLKLQLSVSANDSTARAYERRLTILRGFYQGGTT